MNRSAVAFVSFAALLSLSGAALAKNDVVVVQTTFDSDLGGWTSNTPSEVLWSETGGNPGGDALFTGGSVNATIMIAPASFLSPAVNYTKLDGKAYITFQHQM